MITLNYVIFSNYYRCQQSVSNLCFISHKYKKYYEKVVPNRQLTNRLAKPIMWGVINTVISGFVCVWGGIFDHLVQSEEP